MSSKAIVNAARDLLVAAMVPYPAVTVVKAAPDTLPAGTTVYVYHQGFQDTGKAGPSVIQRTHRIPIHLLVPVRGDDEGAEDAVMDLADVVNNLVYTNHTLGGTARDATITQPDGEDLRVAFGQYVVDGGQEYRRRIFVLHAVEVLTFAMA